MNGERTGTFRSAGLTATQHDETRGTRDLALECLISLVERRINALDRSTTGTSDCACTNMEKKHLRIT